MTWERIGRRATGAFVLFLFAVGALVILPTLLDGWIPSDAIGLAKWTYWLQTISGNWPGSPGVVDRWWFAFSAVVAALLNNSLVFVVGTLIWRWNVERAAVMRLNQAFITRDEMNKQALFRNLSDDAETMKRINVAFSEGERDWKEHLTEMFGKDDAEKLFSALGRNI